MKRRELIPCYCTLHFPLNTGFVCRAVIARSSSKKKDLPAAQDVPQAPPLTTGDGGGDNDGPEEPRNDGNERTWRDTLDDAITIGAAIIISLGIRT